MDITTGLLAPVREVDEEPEFSMGQGKGTQIKNRDMSEACEEDELLNAVVKRLAEICNDKRVNKESLYLHIINNDSFIGAGINKEDCLVITNDIEPAIGDFTLIELDNKKQLIWIIGKSLLNYDIVAVQFMRHPIAKELLNKSYIGKAIGILRKKEIIQL